MSVRMALAKLCACTCGGALIGGGAMQVADTPPAQVQKVVKKKHKARLIAHKAPVRKVKRVRKIVRTTTTTSTCTPTGFAMAGPAMAPIPMAYLPAAAGAPFEGGAGGSVPVVIGGSGGFGGRCGRAYAAC